MMVFLTQNLHFLLTNLSSILLGISMLRKIYIGVNKVLRGIFDARWYVRNSDLHRDLNIESGTDVIKKMAQNHERRPHKRSSY
jgi:hypothetical protein